MATSRSHKGGKLRGPPLNAPAASSRAVVHSATLCAELWEQPVAEFPLFTAGESYLPLPIGSAITLLFIVEKMLFGAQYHRPVVMLGSSS